MKLFIPKDIFNNPTQPRLFLCTTGKKRIGELHNYETNLTGKWGSYSEISFSLDRTYVDVLTGETKVNPLFDKAEGLRMVLAENMGYFIIQDPNTAIGDKDTKNLSCFSSEYSCGQKYLEQFYINTGEEDSKEVIYLSTIYGDSYAIDERYKLATGQFDAYESYYVQQYSDNDSYEYVQVEIRDAIEYDKYDGSTVEKTLYIKKYPNVRFYWPSKPELSLLHLIFETIPDWKIGHVDDTLWRKERKLSQERIAVYDFLMNDVSDVFDCVVEWDTLTNTVNFYEEADDGIADNGTVQSRFETDVFISKDNLASEINIGYSTDNIKTKLKVSGADTLDIREVNLGQNYIMNLDYYHNDDWMEQDLVEAYQRYLDGMKKYSSQYEDAMHGWVEANNKYNEIMNTVPAEGNVVLVGDEFKKLYCVYTPINTAYTPNVITNETKFVNELYGKYDAAKGQYLNPIDKSTLADGEQFVVQGYAFAYNLLDDTFKYVDNMTDTNLNEDNGLLYKLKLYHIDEDTKANESDNILLRLKNADSNVATIRIYNKGTESVPDYRIKTTIVYANGGTYDSKDTDEPTMSQWIRGELTADKIQPVASGGLVGYTITYIGTMGAYFVLAKDERQEVVLEEYGVNLLQTKHDTYLKIFQTQTEKMFSQQDYKCIVQNEPPEGEYDIGTRWLDSDETDRNQMLKTYNGKDSDGKNIWVAISASVSDVDKSNYENYQRYIDNYDKMVAVQKMLLKKKQEAEFWSNGQMLDRTIIYNGSSDVVFYEAAKEYFGAVTKGKIVNDIILTYVFTTPNAEGEFVIYLDGTTPYLMHMNSQGYWQAKMNAIRKLTEMRIFFTDEQWAALSPLIREDEYRDENFLLTSYESEEERLDICRQLMDEAAKKLKTLSQPSLEFSMTMANLLSLPEFEPFVSSEQFALGNFIRIELRPGLVKRARLLECSINFDNFSDFNCTFGNLITTKSEVDLHAELLSQAVQAGKTVATASGTWQAGADKANKLEEEIANGLQNSTLQIGRASGQAITWDNRGLFCRKFKDGSTEEYEDEQIAIINNKLVFTNDNWKTSKAALGEFEADINGDGQAEKLYGLVAEAVVGGYVKGSRIEGGSLQIGDPGDENGSLFIVNADGSVEIKSNGKDKYASTSAVAAIDNAYKYRIELDYTNSTIFNDTSAYCEVTCKVFDYGNDITDQVLAQSNSVFTWIRSSSDSASDAGWKPTYNGAKNKIIIDVDDVIKNSSFSCEVDFDEEKITT